MVNVKPKGLPDGDCCNPWQKIMERLRELETGLSQRVKKVKVNGTTIYPVNDGEIILPDYPEGTGSVNAVKVDDTTYLPDAGGVVTMPDYPPDLSIEVGSLDSRLESVEDDVGNLDIAVSGHGLRLDDAEDDIDALENRMDTAENDIDALEGRMDTAEDDIDALEGRMDTAEQDIDDAETDIAALEISLNGKANMHIDIIDPVLLSEGEVGDLWYNRVDDKLWKCASVTEFDYHWTMVGGGGSTVSPRTWYKVGNNWTNGSSIYTLAELYNYLQGLSTTDEFRANIMIENINLFSNIYFIDSRSSNSITLYKCSITRYNTTVHTCYSTFTSARIKDGTSASIWLTKVDNGSVSAHTYSPGAYIYNNLDHGGVYRADVDQELLAAFKNEDVELVANQNQFGIRAVNTVTLTKANNIRIYYTGEACPIVSIYRYEAANSGEYVIIE